MKRSYRVGEPPFMRFRRWLIEDWSVLGVDAATLRMMRARPWLTARFVKRLAKRLRVVTG